MISRLILKIKVCFFYGEKISPWLIIIVKANGFQAVLPIVRKLEPRPLPVINAITKIHVKRANYG